MTELELDLLPIKQVIACLITLQLLQKYIMADEGEKKEDFTKAMRVATRKVKAHSYIPRKLFTPIKTGARYQ